MVSNSPCPNCGYILPSEFHGSSFQYCPHCGSAFSSPATAHITSEEFEAAYKMCYTDCWNLLQNSGIKITPEFALELHALLYVVSDFSSFAAGHDRTSTGNLILNIAFKHLSTIYQSSAPKLLRNRIEFYTLAVKDLDIHAHALMGTDLSDVHPVLRCCVAFSDCCLNPSYISDYQGSSSTLDAIAVFEFSTDVLNPLTDKIISFCNMLQDRPVISSQPRPVGVSEKAPSPAALTAEKKTDKHINVYGILAFCIILILITTTLIVSATQGAPNSVSPSLSSQPESVPTEPTIILKPFPTPSSGHIFEKPHSLDCVAPFCVESEGSGGYYFVLDPIQYGSGMTSNERTALKNYNFCFYVRAGITTEVLVPLGSYHVYYAYGDTWYGIDNLFGPETVYNKCDDIFTFSKSYDGYDGWTISLEPVVNGNLDTDIISEADFPK